MLKVNKFTFVLIIVTIHHSAVQTSTSKFKKLQRTFYDQSAYSGYGAGNGYSKEKSYSHNSHKHYRDNHDDYDDPSSLANQNLTAIRLANEHFIKIRKLHRCRLPRSKLIRVKDFYNVPSKEYLPR